MALSQGNLKSVLVGKIRGPLAVAALKSQPYLTNNLAKHYMPETFFCPLYAQYLGEGRTLPTVPPSGMFKNKFPINTYF